MDGVTTYPLTQHQTDILETRALDPELLARLGVTGCDRPLPGSVAIPYWKAGKIENYKFRTIAGEKRMAQVSGAPKLLWNVDALSDPTLAQMPVIMTEGEFDAIAVIQAGFSRVVSVPDGAPAHEIGGAETTKYDFLDGFPDSAAAPEIILATDGDGPGVNLMNDLALRLGRARCKWVTYPLKRSGGRCKDFNEVLIDYGPRGIVETLARARWMAVPGLYRMSELPPLSEPAAHEVGIEALAGMYRMRTGDLCVVTGVPNHGKTSFVNEVCFNAARDRRWHVTFASFEQRPQLEHRRSLRTLYAGKWVNRQSAQELALADAFIEAHFSFITPGPEDDPTLEWFLEAAKAAVLRHGARVVVLDPWNEISHVRGTDMTLTEYVGEAIKTLKRFARNYDVHLIICAHPAKMKRDRDGKFPMPALYDISDSANWANKADVGLIIHRDERGVLVRTAKARYPDIGRIGDTRLIFNDQTLRYSSGDCDEQEN